MNRYFKCVDSNGEACIAKDIKVGKIYRTDERGMGLEDESGFVWDKISVIETEEHTFVRCNIKIKFEEVSVGKFIIQEFLNGKIAIRFKEKHHEELAELFLRACEVHPLKNPHKYDINGDGIYYINNSTLEYRLNCEYFPYDVEVVEVSDEDFKSKVQNSKISMKLCDLKPGMVVYTRDGNSGIVMDGFILFNDEVTLLSEYNEEMIHNKYMFDDIMKVGNPNDIEEYQDIIDQCGVKIIWERKSDKEEYDISETTKVIYHREGNISIQRRIGFNCDSVDITLEEAEELIETLKNIVETA